MRNPARVGIAAMLLIMPATTSAVAGSPPPDIRVGDDQLLLVREALQVVRKVGDDLWPGWSRAPKTTVLVSANKEFLLALPSQDAPPVGFEATAQKFMGTPIFSRPRHLSTTLRTALEFGGTPAAVVGAWRPEVESPNEWVVSLVEQWFRLLQLERGELQKISTLHLPLQGQAPGQVEYAFPFDDPDVGNALLLLGQSLYDFWAGGAHLPREGQRTFLAETAWAALQNLRTVLELKHGDEAYRYFQLKVWSEGVTRYSGMLVARAIARAEVADDYRHQRGFDDLPEHQSYAEMWEESMHTRFWLIRTSAREGERDLTTFNAIGHGMAELLDAVNPDWKDHYFDSDVWLDDLVAESLAGPSGAALHQ